MKDVELAIHKELMAAYAMAHRTVPTSSLESVAASIADAVPAITAQNAHDVFRRAMQVEAIPTVPTLVTAVKNHMAETYRETSGTPSIEYRDPCEAWLPKSDIVKRININEAIKNYTIACGGNAYFNLCDARSNGPDYYRTYTMPIKKAIYRLYLKYWRKMPIANGYPASGPISLALIPATVDDFRKMFGYENAGHV